MIAAIGSAEATETLVDELGNCVVSSALAAQFLAELTGSERSLRVHELLAEAVIELRGVAEEIACRRGENEPVGQTQRCDSGDMPADG